MLAGVPTPIRYVGLFLGRYGVVFSIILYISAWLSPTASPPSAYPSRNGRHGHVYTHRGKINLFNAQYELDNEPIEEGCGCPACKNYSKAYIRHLLKAKEMLGMRLCVLHNLYFYNHLMEDIRTAIEEHRYSEFKRQTLYGLQELDGDIYL